MSVISRFEADLKNWQEIYEEILSGIDGICVCILIGTYIGKSVLNFVSE